MVDLAEQLGKRIQRLRSERQMTQTALAAKINVTRAYLSKIERGKNNMRLDTMEEICKGLGIQPEELLSGIEIDQPNS